MPSKAFTVFNGRKRAGVLEIADVFESINNRRGRKTKHGLLNGALVLLVSSWEVYCEDVCLQAAKKIQGKSGIRFSHLSKNLQRELLKYSGESFNGNRDPLDEKIAQLPDNGWRGLLVERLEEYRSDFNTPKFARGKGKSLDGLFRCILGNSMSKNIDELLDDFGFCRRIDEIVTLRGEIAHTGEASAEERLSPEMLREHTSAFVEAAAAVDSIIHREFRSRFNFAPWQLTDRVKNALRDEAAKKL